MALSKQIQLAQARRQLRRLEQDAAALRVRIADLPEHHRRPMMRWFEESVQQGRAAVRSLERSSSQRGRVSAA